MVAAPWRRLTQAARWNGHPPHTTTGAARAREIHCQWSNWSGGTMASTNTGRVSTADTSTRWRRSRSSDSPWCAAPSGAAGWSPCPWSLCRWSGGTGWGSGAGGAITW